MKVEFFVMENASRQQALRELCLLVEKIWQDKESAYIYVNTEEEADYLDKLLWTFRDESFVPHSVKATDETPIRIGTAVPATNRRQTLINLGKTIPDFYTQFQRVIEVVYQDAELQQAARERFKQYRDAG